ncbi:MAG: hypothetical protein EKK64_03595 [Neisseriaceae bacterium]|nr:MAG: hypothetical protein EKK64_03595 [Neisseriaceae bacterium]
MMRFKEFFNLIDVDSQIIDSYLHDATSIKEIAKKFGKTESQIYRILHSHEIKPNRSKANHHKVNILSNLGWNNKEVANFTGYTSRNVRNILNKGK